MPLINCKVELRLKWTKHCVLSAARNENVINENDYDNNIIFAIKDQILHVFVVTLWARDNEKLSKLLNKWFESSIYWNEYKTNGRMKILQINLDIFSNQMLLVSIDYLC